VNIRVRHLTGSRAGEEQNFENAHEVTIGRSPASMILFDPEKDRVVSGRHAALVHDQNRWLLRDLGSSNGTFVDGNRVTELPLRNGTVVQLGANGPRIQVEFQSEEEVAATYVVPLEDLKAPPEGKTVMMMLPPTEKVGAVAAPAAVAARPRKKGGIGRALLIVGAVLFVLLAGVVALAFLARSANLKKRQVAAKKTSTAVSPAQQQASAEAQKKQKEADQLAAQIAATQQNLQQTQATIAQAQQTPATGNSTEIADLKRQLAESQAMLEQMTVALQQKNDEAAAARARASAPPQVRYVERPAPAPARTASRPATTSSPSPATSSPGSPSSRSTTAVASGSPSVDPAPAAAQLHTGKVFKRKILVTPLPPEIPPANLPNGTARDLANLLATALVSTGDFVVGPKGQGSINVMVTNYRADVNKSVDVKRTADNARKLGRLLGQKVPTNPVDVKSTAYDAAMSARVRLFDPSGRVLTETEASAASADRKSKVALGGVSFHEVAMSDTAVGDVARKVIADAVDALRPNLSQLQWTTTIGSATNDKVTLGAGFGSGIEPGDVFQVMDAGKAVVRVRVTNVTENSADAEFIGQTKVKLKGKTALYVGSENPPAAARRDRFLTMRVKSPVFNGPGNSFQEMKTLNPGAKLKLHYVVGSWGKATDNSGTYWVPLAAAAISS
jgi:hypothetical protein